MTKISFINNLFGARLDVRGGSAPAPAANRLFIPDTEYWRIRKPFIRATLRHACNLAASDGADAAWRTWMGAILGRAARHLEPEDVEYCAETFGYLIQEDGGRVKIEPSAIQRRFGRRVPIATDSASGGLVSTDFLTKILTSEVVDGIRYGRLP